MKQKHGSRHQSHCITLVMTLLMSASACQERSGDSKLQEASAAELASRHEVFLSRLAAAPSSSYDGKDELAPIDARCPYPFAKGALSAYFDAALSGERADIHARVLELSAQLRCVGAARFRDVQLAIEAALAATKSPPTDEVRRRVEQILTPVVFLTFDLGGADLRRRIYPWLFIKLGEFHQELLDTDSPIRRAGLWAASDLGIVELSTDDVRGLLETLATGAWLSGRCGATSIARLVVGDEGEEIEIPYCPQDCLDQDASRSLGGLVLRDDERVDELDEVCRGVRDQADRLASSSIGARARDCLEEFSDANRDFMGCVVDASVSPHMLGSFQPTRTAQDFAVGRRCQLTQDGGRPRRGRIETTVRTNETSDGHQWVRRSTHYDTNGDQVLQISVTRDFDEDGNVSGSAYQVTDSRNNTTTIVYTSYDEDGVASSTVVNIDANGDETARPCKDLSDCLDDAPSQNEGAAGQCSAIQDSCSSDCSLADQMLDDLGQCFVADGAADPTTGPDPRVTMPTPDAVGALGAETTGLAQCLMDAFTAGGTEPVTQNDCRAYLRCPDQDWPRGENCTCLPSQRAAGPLLRDLCQRMQCDEQTSTCPCDRITGQPAGDPTAPGPDPAPRLSVLGEIQ